MNDDDIATRLHSALAAAVPAPFTDTSALRNRALRRLRRRQVLATVASAAVLGTVAVTVISHGDDTRGQEALVASQPAEGIGTSDAAALFGKWTFSANGRSGSLELGENLRIVSVCGSVGGEWRAASEQSLFVGNLSSWSAGCQEDVTRHDFAWVTNAVSFAPGPSEDSMNLLSADGTIQAQLTKTSADDFALAQDKARAPVGGTAVPVAGQELTSLSGVTKTTWMAQSANSSGPATVLRFQADGSWSAASCSNANGRFTLGKDGRAVFVVGPRRGAFCQALPVAEWLTASARIVVSQTGELQFFDALGHLLGAVNSE